MAQYGIPYMGSKDSICDELVRIFPKAKNFYDLFGGGFSVTHAMMVRRSKDFSHFHYNEIRPGMCELIKDAIAGKYSYDFYHPPWVSREEFFEKLDKDPLIKILWSFGNNGKAYLFGKQIEPYKRSMHNAIVFNEFDELAKQVFQMENFKEGYSIQAKRLFLRNKIEHYRKTKVPEFLWPFLNEKSLAIVKRGNQPEHLQQLQHLEQLQQVERLEQLERLERLQQLRQLERLSFSNKSYDEIKIESDSVIYCDPPYAGTADYDGGFNHKKFFDWADAQSVPVFISEYDISDKRFTCVWKIEKRSMLSSDKTMKLKQEKVYLNKAGIEILKSSGKIK